MRKSFVLAALLVSFNASAAVNLIQNGDFEDYPVTSGTAVHVYTGTYEGCMAYHALGEVCVAQNSSYDWQPITGAPSEFLEIRENLAGTAQNGVNFAELNPEQQSGITQTFSAAVGTGLLSWWDKSRYGDKHYLVYLNSDLIYDGTTDNGDDWFYREYNVNLLSSNTLSFISNTYNYLWDPTKDSDDIGAQIDNISVVQTSTAVPEPETYGMLMAGLALLGLVARRRKA